jgi:TetR/AcrR family transcriptional regulator, transcriptional repressor for nem operon
MVALAQEVVRSTPELKAAYERGFEEIRAARGGDRKETIFQSATIHASADLQRRAIRPPSQLRAAQ